MISSTKFVLFTSILVDLRQQSIIPKTDGCDLKPPAIIYGSPSMIMNFLTYKNIDE